MPVITPEIAAAAAPPDAFKNPGYGAAAFFAGSDGLTEKGRVPRRPVPKKKNAATF